NLKIVGSTELILPLPFVEQSNTFRITAFMDGGNVYSSEMEFDVDTLRYSAGFGAIWLSPIGPLTLSFAEPLKTEDGDETQRFQLTFGTSF
ncbi:MAG: BamA/TamA family outer membrane protein, partial [Rhodococcus sp.]|nr:BamA/TamA family outer membrane protein [Rhodococcus sp. (in: high G+C Gram-positive bacteria)]